MRPVDWSTANSRKQLLPPSTQITVTVNYLLTGQLRYRNCRPPVYLERNGNQFVGTNREILSSCYNTK